MLKRTIKYKDFNDNEVSEDFYFNISRAELVRLEMSFDDGIEKAVKKMMETKDRAALINQFEDLVLKAYGQKSEDGKRFIKSTQLREEFAQHAAYEQLFFELITNEQTIADFILGVLPKDLAAQVREAQPQDKPLGLPPRPPMPPKSV